MLGTVRADDRVEGDVGIARFDPVGQLDVRQLRAADGMLLHLNREGVPGLQVMQVFLDDDVTRAGEVRVLIADGDGLHGGPVGRVFGPVDETEQVAHLEVLEPVHFVDDGDGAAQTVHDLGRQLETEVHGPGPDVEQQVPGCDHGPVLRSGELPEPV
jgi:hypothetical protein